MKFRKIKYDGSEVELKWETRTTVPAADGGKPSTDVVSHAFKSNDTPLPEFVDALQAFRSQLVEVLGLPEDWLEEVPEAGRLGSFHILSASINREADERLGVVFTMKRAVSIANAPLVINSPHLRELTMEESVSAGGFMPDRWLGMVAALEEQAQRYVKGERAQGDLFSQDAEPVAA